MNKISKWLVVLGFFGAAIFWFLTQPVTLSEEELASLDAHVPDVVNGENLFWAGGCASCHAAPNAEGDDKKLLSGGHVLKSDFGDFQVPNISQHATQGIGNWSLTDFFNAMKKGVSPDGRHYYPAFPYASYTHMTDVDIADLFAYMKTLPASDQESQTTSLSFPFNIRRGLGLWKKLYLIDAPIISDAVLGGDEQLLRGRYLVEGAGHCGECHTPRTIAGGMDRNKWLVGAPNPDGKGVIPGITNSDDDLGGWSATDISYALETGFTPEFDSLGGSMNAVVENYSNVLASDREAIASYLKHIKPE